MASDKDRERAEAYVSRINDSPTSTGAAGALAEQFAAVRAEERARIVVWLREEDGMSGAGTYRDAIEADEHEKE